MLREKVISAWSGIPVLLLTLVLLVLPVVAFVMLMKNSVPGDRPALALWACGVLWFGNLIAMAGFFTVQPNQGVVLTLFGRYIGTAAQQGLRWANPFFAKKHVSLRVRNFETSKMKVNDQDGNPIEIAAVVVWKVVDTAEAIFQVDAFENYVHVQSEAAVRNLATTYPYDAHDDVTVSLRGNTAQVAEELKREIQDRLQVAGVEVIESRISHLAYAPEIASAMLRRQQAGAVIAARTKIVEGAVGMVEMALEALARNRVVELDGEQKAAMVSNLLVVLCGETAASPVVNTGTLHQ
ncbi:MAG: SPFH domain-containing protein [Bryobacteraceae bacterium]|jgi:regulator of protease activity HflC (stomatin/prohibitin superfamily)|nr:SPFH domain-containing protein [Solibacteraceae bacterium]MCO5351317.1 SPFH domain-containing protein [Bryobacteraceae bacterium]